MTTRLLLTLLGALLLFIPAESSAASRNGVWNGVHDPGFPIVPVFGCPGRFGTNFPGFPWGNISSQAHLAMNEWFVGGGADVRMRYEGDLADTDSRCVSETPDTGTILISAEKNNGGGNCNLATTFYDADGNGNNTQALVIMHRGTVCNGFYQDFDWATNADYPQANQVDFQSVFLHELGHALGFNHSADPNAIMWPFVPTGDTTKRILGDDDVRGLFSTFPYAPTQLNMFDVWTNNNGASWNRNNLGTAFSVGSPASCVNNDTASDTYQGAWTDPYPNQTVETFSFQSGFASGEAIGAPTEMAPGIACGSDRTWYGWVNSLTGNVDYYWNVGGSWQGPFTVPFHSAVPPTVAELHNASGAVTAYLLAYMDLATGYLQTLVSTDKLTFPTSTLQNYQPNNIRSFHAFGVACMPSSPQCVVTYADGRTNGTPMMSVILSVNPGSSPPITVTGGPTPIGGSDGFGGAIGFNSNGSGSMSVWRDRGFNTVLASTTSGTINWSTVTIQNAPTLVWADHYNTFAAFYSYSDRYNTH